MPTVLPKTTLICRGMSVLTDATARLTAAEIALRSKTQTAEQVIAAIDTLDAETAGFLAVATEIASGDGALGQLVLQIIALVQAEKQALRALASDAQAALDNVLNPQT